MSTLLALLTISGSVALWRKRFDLWSLAIIGGSCLVVVIVQHIHAVSTINQVLE